ncbi:MAG: hypothetical protein F6K10_02690 [Moorea sp. SIO2B7]|nr:hypothetical protein [Moorena sp. SIO2B7]
MAYIKFRKLSVQQKHTKVNQEAANGIGLDDCHGFCLGVVCRPAVWSSIFQIGQVHSRWVARELGVGSGESGVGSRESGVRSRELGSQKRDPP